MEYGFKKLILWQLSHELTLEIYKITLKYPSCEMYCLVSQMRRAAYSVPANIVEGYSRNTTIQYLYFLSIAKASLEELKYFLILSLDLKYIEAKDFNFIIEKAENVGKMLNATTLKLNNNLKGKNP